MDGVAAPDGSDEDEEYDRLPAGNEKEWQKQCYFCGVVGSKRKNSKRGKKGVQFVRRLRTQRENPDECAAGRPSTGMPSNKYFPPDAAGRPRSLLPREEQARQTYPAADTPHWACASKRQGHASCAHSNQALILAVDRTRVATPPPSPDPEPAAARPRPQPGQPPEVTAAAGPRQYLGAPPELVDVLFASHVERGVEHTDCPLWRLLAEQFLSLQQAIALSFVSKRLRHAMRADTSYREHTMLQVMSLPPTVPVRYCPCEILSL